MIRRVKAAVTNTKFWMVAAALSALFALATAIFAITTNVDIPLTRGVAAISGKELRLSPVSKRELQGIVNKEEMVVAISAVSVSLAKNTRVPTFFYSDVPEFARIYDNFITNQKEPIRTYSDDKRYNNRVTTILNGNFDCREFKETLAKKFYPEAEHIAPWLCSMAVPPGFDPSGDFVGWLVFYLNQEPSTQDQKRLARIAVDASTAIYRRDMTTQPRE